MARFDTIINRLEETVELMSMRWLPKYDRLLQGLDPPGGRLISNNDGSTGSTDLLCAVGECHGSINNNIKMNNNNNN